MNNQIAAWIKEGQEKWFIKKKQAAASSLSRVPNFRAISIFLKHLFLDSADVRSLENI